MNNKDLTECKDTSAQFNVDAYRQDIKNRAQALLQHVNDKHSKTFFVRFDVRFPEGFDTPKDNQIFRTFMANFAKNLDRKGYDPHYLWVREQANADKQHYHVALLLNGNKVQKSYPVLQTASKLWTKKVNADSGANGLVHYCNKSYRGEPKANELMIRRGSSNTDQLRNETLNSMNYLAKEYSKGSAPHCVREFGSSRLK